MKKLILLIMISGMAAVIAGCAGKKVKQTPVPDGYQGIYVVKVWKGDNSVLPKDLTGLVLKRKGVSYDIILSNIDEKSKTAEEIEDLDFTYADGEFIIKFGGIMKVKPVKDGLQGTLDFYGDGKAAELFLKKIK